jgi:hypothetical protein
MIIPTINIATGHEYVRERRYSSTIFNFGTRLRGVVRFTPLPLYSRGNSPGYPSYTRLKGPQSRSELYGERKQPRTQLRPYITKPTYFLY